MQEVKKMLIRLNQDIVNDATYDDINVIFNDIGKIINYIELLKEV